ncbi:DUF4124 domain-containing protein [Lysobacter sp. D1-1-M9]|uniref:DUF4124 domain-containing protein n=1 Tax=Novilysobacter longmucuonensis TaxID=3098603 RepID=UPI002FCC7430
MSSATARPTLRPSPWFGAALALAALAAAPVSAEDIYQWKDANGVTHYSDSPPPEGAYQNRTITSAGASAAAESVEGAQCSDARKRLAQLRSDGPVGFDTDEDGRPDSTMDAEQRAAQTRLAEAAIAAACTARDSKAQPQA